MTYRLLATALGLTLSAFSAQAAEDTWISLGAREPLITISSSTGIGTANAVVEGKLTEEEAKDHCENFRPMDSAEETRQCVDGLLREYDKTYRITADCVAGKITTVYGDSFTYAGERTRVRETESPHVTLWKDADGKVLPSGPLDYGLLVTQNWSAVCGRNFKAAAVAQTSPSARPSKSIGAGTALWTVGPRPDGFDGLAYTHNGSMMYVDERHCEIRYDVPKKAIAGTVKPGTVLFRGTFRDLESDPANGYMRSTVSGTAFVFKKGCAPAPYAVEGTYDSTTITMTGRAPERDRNSCRILELTDDSPHAVLKFEFSSDL
jgi:hypothetical protein